MSKLLDFFKDVRAELAKVSWPTRRDTTNYTFVVIGLTVALAIFLAVFDYLFQYVLQTLVIR